MGRDWPPNSFAEWMVGQNFRSQRPQPTSGQNPILRVEISEDEASGDEIVAITYPRRRRKHASRQDADGEEEPASSELTSTVRKVRFDGDEKPLKSALKKTTASPSSSEDTLVDTSDTSGSEGVVDSSEVEDSSDGASEKEGAPATRSKGASKKAKPIKCKKYEDSEDSSTDKDVLPHPTCDCRKCHKARRIVKALIASEAREAAQKEAEAKAKEEADKKEAEAKAKEEAEKKEQQAKEKKEKQKKKAEEDKPTDTSQAETSEVEAKEDDKKKQKGKNKKEKEQEKPSLKTSEELAEKIVKAVNKAVFKMPKYPKEMEPNLIMPIRSKVMQVEHALEGPNDPRPNTFYDAAKGIARVYHGPQYGNHMAELYGKSNVPTMLPGSVPPDQHGFPGGWPIHPTYGPWPFPGPPPGFPGYRGPSGTPFEQRLPAMNAQPPQNEEEMKAAAAKGFGLSGQPAPQTPAAIRQFQQEELQKAASGSAGGKNNGNWNPGSGIGWEVPANMNWGNFNTATARPDPPADIFQGWPGNGGNGGNGAGWDSASKQGGINSGAGWGEPTNPAPQPDPPADASQGQAWGSNGDSGGGGWNSGAKQTGNKSPMNFDAWGNASGDKFERHSNKSGSQRGWNSGKPGSQPAGPTHAPSAKGSPNKPADWSQGGGGDTWGQNGTQNTVWGAENHDLGGWNQNNNQDNGRAQGGSGGGWGAMGANGEQGQPSNAPHHTSSPPPPADAADGPQADNGANGGGNGWGQSDGWGAPPGSYQQQQQQQQQGWFEPGNQEPNVWGGPPGSKPASQKNGSNGWQVNETTWDNNNGKNPSPPQKIPGTWNQGGSRRASPSEKNVGAFDWPKGQQVPPNTGSGWGAPSGGPGWNGYHQKGDTSGGWDKPSSNEATAGPSYQNNAATSSWANPALAQHTGGAADNW